MSSNFRTTMADPALYIYPPARMIATVDVDDSLFLPTDLYDRRLWAKGPARRDSLDEGVPKLLVGFTTKGTSGLSKRRLVFATIVDRQLGFFMALFTEDNEKIPPTPGEDESIDLQDIQFFANFEGLFYSTLEYYLRLGLDMPHLSWRQIFTDTPGPPHFSCYQYQPRLQYCEIFFGDGATLMQGEYSEANIKPGYRPWTMDSMGNILNPNNPGKINFSCRIGRRANDPGQQNE